jgi:3-hydroxyacyl-CoA dehydrogenase
LLFSGAGTMGARIAAHFANAGVPSLLLDIVPPDADGPARNKIAAAGLEGARKSKPAAFFEPSLSRLVTVGNFDDDLKRLADVDWIIEAIVENLDIKRALLKNVEASQAGHDHHYQHQRASSGEDRRGIFRRLSPFMVRHAFFNPPRYMRLLELIPTPDADRALIEAVTHFCDANWAKASC